MVALILVDEYPVLMTPHPSDIRPGGLILMAPHPSVPIPWHSSWQYPIPVAAHHNDPILVASHPTAIRPSGPILVVPHPCATHHSGHILVAPCSTGNHPGSTPSWWPHPNGTPSQLAPHPRGIHPCQVAGTVPTRGGPAAGAMWVAQTALEH